jgi:hypothetical protein
LGRGQTQPSLKQPADLQAARISRNKQGTNVLSAKH